MIGNNGDGVVEAHHLTHTLDCQRRAVVDAGEVAAKNRARSNGRYLHARYADIDAKLRLAVHLLRRVETLGRRSDQLKVLGILERHFSRHRQPRGQIDERSISEAPTCWWVNNLAAFGKAAHWVHMPATRCGRNQHDSSGSASMA